MKNIQKTLAITLAIVMVLALSVSAFAAGTGSITITPPTGVDTNATNTYKIYKVFDADGNGEGISYKLVDGKTTTPAGFSVDNQGNVTYTGTGTDGLTDDDIAAIAAYVTENDLVATVTSTGSAAAVAEGLANGYYYITTTTGTVVVIDSTNPNAAVEDKNTVPTVDKKITGASSYDEDGKKALAQVGTDVEFTAIVTVGKGAEGYVFHDKMDAALSFNNDVTVTGIKADQWSQKTTPDADDTFTLTFVDGLAEGTVITIKYSAKVTSDALQDDPAKNTAKISYGENSQYTSQPSETEVYNAKFTVTKQDGNNQPLAGAGFVIANADGKYYKLVAATENESAMIEWVSDINDATEYTSDVNGAVTAFTGLADGTYTLVEKTVPAGYNKAADSTFTVEKGNYTADNLKLSKTVINNAGTELPSTGGIGTTIFYIVGGILVLAAVVVLVTKKRMSAE